MARMSLESFDDRFPDVHPSAFVHPNATLIGDVRIGAHSSVWPGAVLRADYAPIRIGAKTSVQENVVVHVAPDGGTQIGSLCIIGHLAFLEQALVEDCCQVGVGARILNGARMRRGSAAAAQAVVLGRMEVPSGMRAQGIPATLVPMSRPTLHDIQTGAEMYVETATRMADALRRPVARTPSREGSK
jgi:carbonic anhydrase/acetyltransferase-like protein (isoleucine patch superfamily)